MMWTDTSSDTFRSAATQPLYHGAERLAPCIKHSSVQQHSGGARGAAGLSATGCASSKTDSHAVDHQAVPGDGVDNE